METVNVLFVSNEGIPDWIESFTESKGGMMAYGFAVNVLVLVLGLMFHDLIENPRNIWISGYFCGLWAWVVIEVCSEPDKLSDLDKVKLELDIVRNELQFHKDEVARLKLIEQERNTL